MNSIYECLSINDKMIDLLKRESYFFMPKRRVLSLNEFADKGEECFNIGSKEIFVQNITLPIYKIDYENLDECDKDFIRASGISLNSSISIKECDLTSNVSNIVVLHDNITGIKKHVNFHMPNTVYVKVPEYCVNKLTLIKIQKLECKRNLVYNQMSKNERDLVTPSFQKTELIKQARDQEAESFISLNIANVLEEQSSKIK